MRREMEGCRVEARSSAVGRTGCCLRMDDSRLGTTADILPVVICLLQHRSSNKQGLRILVVNRAPLPKLSHARCTTLCPLILPLQASQAAPMFWNPSSLALFSRADYRSRLLLLDADIIDR